MTSRLLSTHSYYVRSKNTITSARVAISPTHQLYFGVCLPCMALSCLQQFYQINILCTRVGFHCLPLGEMPYPKRLGVGILLILLLRAASSTYSPESLIYGRRRILSDMNDILLWPTYLQRILLLTKIHQRMRKISFKMK